MLNQQPLEKNVPPQPTSRPNHKRSRINRVATSNNKGKWTNQALEEAMDSIEKGTCSLKVTSKSWNIQVTPFLDQEN
jgi:hypothetical protein